MKGTARTPAKAEEERGFVKRYTNKLEKNNMQMILNVGFLCPAPKALFLALI